VLKIALADGEVRRAIESGDSDRVDRVAKSLNEIPVMTASGDLAPRGTLFAFIRAGYLRESETSDALVTIHTETSQRFDELTVTLQNDGAARATFSYNVATLSPILAAELHRLHPRSPAVIERLSAELAFSDDRGMVLSEWAARPPSWLQLNAELAGWLGEASLLVRESACALTWFDRAIEEGALPLAYWKLRRVSAASGESIEDSLAYLMDVADHPLVQGCLGSTPREERVSLIESWEATTPIQKAFQSVLAAQAYRDVDRLDEAIHIGRDAWEIQHSGAAGLVAVECLMRRTMTADRRRHGTDLGDAIDLALQIRDSQRTWRVSSGRSVHLAIRASILLSDLDRAWRLGRVAPEGEATPEEADDPDVRDEIITLMAERGNVADALLLLDETTSASTRLEIEAIEAEFLLDETRARELWARAIDAETDWNLRASMCWRQATRGYLDPFVEVLRVDNPEIAAEMDIVAALFGDAPGAAGVAESVSVENPRIAHMLIAYFAQKNQHSELIVAAERAAQTWGSADDWLKAAQAHYHQGEFLKAADRASKALHTGGTHWGDRFAAHTLLLECAFQAEDWPTALLSSTSMLAIQPNSVAARWSLIVSSFMAGDEDAAYLTWKEAIESPLLPRSEIEASIWIAFFRSRGTAMALVTDLLSIAAQFTNSENIRALALGALVVAPVQEESPRVDLTALFEQHAVDFPGSPFRAVTSESNDPSAVIADMDATFGQREDTSAIEAALLAGSLPAGALSETFGRYYTEDLIYRRRSPRFAGFLSDHSSVAAVASAVGGLVIVDTSAILTLALLPSDAANYVAGRFALRSTNDQLLDAIAARESIARPVSGHFIPSTDESPARFVQEDPINRDEMRALSRDVIEWFRRTERISNPRPPSPALEEIAGPWSSAADFAIKTNTPMWCDDAATRRLLEDADVPTFGTPAIIEQARLSAALPTDFADSIDAALIHRWCVGVPFRANTYGLALALDGFLPVGTAAVLRHSGGSEADSKFELMLDAMARSIAEPDSLRGWASVAVGYLTEVTSGEEAIRDNIAVVWRRTLTAAWMTPSSLPFIVAGVRGAQPERWEATFRAGVRDLYSSLARQVGTEIAGQYAMQLVGSLPEDERLVGLSAVLAR
jgi:tetratricopeptide (TPR) repeat protein